jgi:hypothetical protein
MKGPRMSDHRRAFLLWGIWFSAVAAFGPTMLLLIEYISVAAVTADYGSALTAGHFFQTPKK